MLEVLDGQIVPEQGAKELNDKVLQQVADIVQGVAAQAGTNVSPKTNTWFYSIPCPGVRYYSYQ